METLDDPVGLRAFDLGASVIDILHRQVELVFVMFGGAAVLGPAIGQHALQRHAVLIEERDDPVIEQVSRHQRGLAIIRAWRRPAWCRYRGTSADKSAPLL